MGLSVAAVTPVTSGPSYVTKATQAYTLNNESEISSAYREAVGNTATPQAVMGTPPVQYAARRYNVSSPDNLSATRKIAKGYNDIASSFGGVNTSYDRNREASAYSITGSRFDAFA